MHLAMVELDHAGAAVQILLRPMVVRIVAGLARRHSFATEITAKYQESGHLGLRGDLVAGHVAEGHDHACVIASIVRNSAPVPFAGVLGLEPRDVIPMFVQLTVPGRPGDRGARVQGLVE